MKVALTALMLLFAAAAAAETRYVNDDLVITLRSGQGNTYQILRSLHSGTPLEVLEPGGQYSRVRTSDGMEGWVLSQYLTDTPIAKERLARAEKRLAQLQSDKQQLQSAIADLKQEKSAAEKAQRSLGSENEKLNKELDNLRNIAARPIELDRENSQLKQQVLGLQRQLEQLSADNARLGDRTQREWFLTGAGVLLGGILLGLILPMLRRKKRTGMFD